jgi:hypothetical protein
VLRTMIRGRVTMLLGHMEPCGPRRVAPPPLPSALANAVTDVPEDVARLLVGAVAASRTITDHVSAVTRRHVLLPVLTHGGVRWISHDSAGTLVVSIPNWTRAPSTVQRLFVEGLSSATEDILFIEKPTWSTASFQVMLLTRPYWL